MSPLGLLRIFGGLTMAINSKAKGGRGERLLVNEFLSAGDMSGDNKINYLDYVRIYNKIKELKGGSN